MKKNIKIYYRIVSFLIMTAIMCPAIPAFSYEREIANLSSILSADMMKTGKKTIAVVDFTDLQGHVNELGRFLAEEMSGNLTSQSKGFDVLDRNHIKRIMEEQQLSLSGLMDPRAMKKIGKLAGTDIIITGTITPFGDSIRVACKAIDTETGKVTGSARGNIAKTATIADLLKLGVGSDSTAKVAPITIYNVSGQWKSNINLIYNITQQQNNFQWTVTNSTEKGKGTLSGYDISASWQGPQGGGSTQGKITEVDAQGKATKIIWNNGVQFYR